MVPYIFNAKNDCKIVDRLVHHVYQKSLSEFLNKLLGLNHADFEGELGQIIAAKQKQVIGKLIEKLGSDEIEDQLNATTLLSENIENREYFNIIAKRENLTQLFEIAFSHVNEECRKSGLNVIVEVLNVFIEKHRNADHSEEPKKAINESEDYEVVQQEEPEHVESPEEIAISQILMTYIGQLPELLSKAPNYRVNCAMADGGLEPLGQYRLHLTRLVNLILKFNKDELNNELLANDIFRNLSELITKHPWNNFFQLKIISIYEEILEHSKDAQFRQKALKSSMIVETILGITESPSFTFVSERQIRHGYMGMIIRISNSLQSAQHNQEVADFLDNSGEQWSKYVKGDLKKINETNNKKLGGQEPKAPGPSDEEEQTFEPMDSIMARFSNFSERSSENNQDDDDDEEESEEFDSRATETRVSITNQSTGIIEVEMPEEETEGAHFSGNIYWNRKPVFDEAEIDLSDFE